MLRLVSLLDEALEVGETLLDLLAGEPEGVLYPEYILRAMPRKPPLREAEELTVRGVEGFFEKVVSRFGNGAKIDCPRQYLGRAVYVIVRRPGAVVKEGGHRRRARPQS